MQDSALQRTYVSSTVAVVGLGKIGLPLAVHYAQHGSRVIGCDINPSVIEAVNAGRSPVQEVVDTSVATLVEQGLLVATSDIIAAVREADVVVVIVPVVIDERHAVSFDSIDATTEAIGKGLGSQGERKGRPDMSGRPLVIYETTLPVGTTGVRFRRILERSSQLQAGRDFYLAYSPERVSSGSIFRDLGAYPKVVGGIDQDSTNAAVAFYSAVLEAEIMAMASTDEAEFVKLIETTYRDVNIALANEFACYADAHGLDVVAAIAAANTQPYSHIHMPGVGVGGHCIPVYPYFLLAGVEGEAKEAGEARASASTLSGRQVIAPPFLMLPRASRRINDGMAEYAARRVEAILGTLHQQKVLILGAAYRGDVRELAFTSADLLQRAFLQHGARVYVDDPLFHEQELRARGYTPLPEGGEEDIAAIVVQSAHTAYQQFDFRRFPHCRVVLDGRRAFSRAYITQFGMTYIAIGDGQYRQLCSRGDGLSSSWERAALHCQEV